MASEAIRGFCLDGGAVAERGPWLWYGAVAGGYAVISLEPTNPAARAAARLAMATLRTALDDPERSVTTRLIEALRLTHERVLDSNARGLRSERTGLAVTCLVLRGAEAYFGQAGPAAAWVRRNGTLWTVAAGHEDEGNGLGWLGLDPGLLVEGAQLSRTPLAGVDAMLVGGRAWGELLGEAALLALLAEEPQVAAATLYRLARDQPALAAAVLRPASLLPAEAPQGPAPPPLAVPPRRRRSTESGAPLAVGALRARATLVALVGLVALALFAGAGWMLPRLAPLPVAGGAGVADQLAAAQHAYDRSRSESDRARQRSLLQEARRLVGAALTQRPGDPEALLLQDLVLADLRALDGLIVLTDARVLVDPPALGGAGATIDRLVQLRNTLNLLDSGRDRVFALSLAGRDDGLVALARSGDRAGATTLGQLVDLFYLPEGGLRTASALVVVDEQRRYVAIEAGGALRPLVVRNAAGWREPRRSLGYAGNLYVLDPGSDQVWRYFPTESGYDSEPRGLLPATRLAGAVDLAIDGDLWVLGAGWVRRYTSGGDERVAGLEGIDRPLLNASSIFTSPEHRYVYIADRGNGRIVALTKDGRFHRQYQADAIRSPAQVVADERNFRLFVVSDNRLYQASYSLN